MAATPLDCDVIIVGYGPSGVSAANFLGARGVKACAFERAKDIYPRARAVTVNDWTMRCYQSVGLDARLAAVMDETVALRWVTYDGRELRRVTFPPADMGHPPSYAIYQPAMEEVLREGVHRYADHVQVRFGAEVVDLVQDAEGVTATVADAEGATSQVRARYALACDGGSSRVREALGIKLLGDTVDTTWVVIDAKVKRWWPDRQLLTFWSDRERPVVDIALAMGNHRWELPLKPTETEADFETHEQLWALLDTMGVSRGDVEIHQHAFYKHHVRRAERWREGRVFLVGDSAHLMPPWAGQGMQSGVRDAHMLSWKLAEVLAGRLPEAALDTYEAERGPDVERCTQLAIGLGHIIRQSAEAPPPPPGVTPPPAPAPAAPRVQAGWITGEPRAANAVGRMVPQPRVSTPTGLFRRLDDLLGSGFVLLGDGIAPQTLLTPGQRADWEAVGARFVTVRGVQDRAEGPDEIVDLDGELAAWMRTHKARVVAVRPDRFVAAVDGVSLARPDVAAATALSRREEAA